MNEAKCNSLANEKMFMWKWYMAKPDSSLPPILIQEGVTVHETLEECIYTAWSLKQLEGADKLLVVGEKPWSGSQFCESATRLATYDNWPKYHPCCKKELAKAGFVYTGMGDKTSCPFCDLTMQDWARIDKPLDEHLKQKPDCPYVRMVCISGQEAEKEEPPFQLGGGWRNFPGSVGDNRNSGLGLF